MEVQQKQTPKSLKMLSGENSVLLFEEYTKSLSIVLIIKYQTLTASELYISEMIRKVFLQPYFSTC